MWMYPTFTSKIRKSIFYKLVKFIYKTFNVHRYRHYSFNSVKKIIYRQTWLAGNRESKMAVSLWHYSTIYKPNTFHRFSYNKDLYRFTNILIITTLLYSL